MKTITDKNTESGLESRPEPLSTAIQMQFDFSGHPAVSTFQRLLARFEQESKPLKDVIKSALKSLPQPRERSHGWISLTRQELLHVPQRDVRLLCKSLLCQVGLDSQAIEIFSQSWQHIVHSVTIRLTSLKQCVLLVRKSLKLK